MFKYGMIMAGGLGSRLRPLTKTIPKPLLPIGEKPIIQFIIEQMKDYGIEKIFISVNYKKEVIKNYLRTGERFGLHIQYLEEKERMGTAGALRMLPVDLDSDLLVSNGDLISSVDYKSIYDKLKTYDFVITGIEKKMYIDFGVLNVKDESELIGWEEKPNHVYLINGGIYGVSKNVLQMVHNKTFDCDYLDMPTLWEHIKKENMKIGVHIHRGEWEDIGRMEDYVAINEKREDITG